MPSNTYSFIDVEAAISGPGGSFGLSNGAGPSEEGITITQTDDRTSMVIGADGSGMHSLHAGRSGTVTVRLLKTSPVNQMLMDMYNFQASSSANTGQNLISLRNIQSGDVVRASQAAFRRAPDLSYAKDGNTVEWSWNAVTIDYKLGNGQPAAL